jgi:hypothetical protein
MSGNGFILKFLDHWNQVHEADWVILLGTIVTTVLFTFFTIEFTLSRDDVENASLEPDLLYILY